MQLSEDEIRLINGWAEETGYVEGVWLFGSRAKGTATPASDVDLAIDTKIGHYVCLGDQWQSDLTHILGLKAHIKFKNAKDGRISRWCNEHGIQLYPTPCL